jgi:hypothetical protein
MNRNNRSNSSAALRNALKQNLGYVPDISPNVSFKSYTNFAKSLHQDAVEAYKQGDLRRAYIDLQKFCLLVIERIPLHKDFRSATEYIVNEKKSLDRIKHPGLELLENVVCMLDREVDLQNQHSAEFELIDEFDGDDTELTESVQVAIPAPKRTEVLPDASVTKDLDNTAMYEVKHLKGICQDVLSAPQHQEIARAMQADDSLQDSPVDTALLYPPLDPVLAPNDFSSNLYNLSALELKDSTISYSENAAVGEPHSSLNVSTGTSPNNSEVLLTGSLGNDDVAIMRALGNYRR